MGCNSSDIAYLQQALQPKFDSEYLSLLQQSNGISLVVCVCIKNSIVHSTEKHNLLSVLCHCWLGV